jgi:hypothetical protein
MASFETIYRDKTGFYTVNITAHGTRRTYLPEAYVTREHNRGRVRIVTV